MDHNSAQNPARDPYNTAVAAILNDRYVAQGSPLADLADAVGVSRMSVRRYLNGDRQIHVVELRKFVDALNLSIGDVLAEAERRIQ